MYNFIGMPMVRIHSVLSKFCISTLKMSKYIIIGLLCVSVCIEATTSSSATQRVTASDSGITPQFVVIVTTVIGVLSIAVLLFIGTRNAEKPEDVSKSLLQEYSRTNFEESDDLNIKNKSVLSPSEFRPFHILDIKQVSYNTRLYRIEIPFGKSLNLPVGRHISVKAEVDGRSLIRAYTPTSSPTQQGYFDLLIKSYDFGQMSKYLASCKPGDKLLVRGPVGNYKLSKNQHGGIGLIAGGSGLTPCLQLVRTVLESNSNDAKKSPEAASLGDWSGDRTKFVLLYQNRTEEDILLRDELVSLAKRHPKRFSVEFFLSGAISDDSTFGQLPDSHEHRGTITSATIRNFIPTADFQQVCICGPSGFNNAMKSLLLKSEFSAESLHVW